MISIFLPKKSLADNTLSPQGNIVVVDFPLRGIWITPNSPGTRVPSHGTSNFGESYAIDFV